MKSENLVLKVTEYNEKQNDYTAWCEENKSFINFDPLVSEDVEFEKAKEQVGKTFMVEGFFSDETDCFISHGKMEEIK